MPNDSPIAIEIVAGVKERQRLIELQVQPGTTAEQAVAESKILRYFPEFGDVIPPFGIWGVVVQPNHVLRDGERLELYRPLKIEPREARRQLAALGRTMREGLAD